MPVDLASAFERLTGSWSPLIVGELNGQHVKIAQLDGTFVWHHHDTADELFLVLAGRLRMRYRDRADEELGPGQLTVVPRGVEHCPETIDGPVQVVLFEPAGTRNTGTAGGPRTVEPARLDTGTRPAAAPATPALATCLWFRDQAEQAARFYAALVPGSAVDEVVRGAPDGPAVLVRFTLAGVPYQARNGAREDFSETASISITTPDQAETDRIWAQLTAGGGRPGRCGWCVDRFGVSWQVVPAALPRLLSSADRAAAERATDAMMGMQKIDIAAMESAFRRA